MPVPRSVLHFTVLALYITAKCPILRYLKMKEERLKTKIGEKGAYNYVSLPILTSNVIQCNLWELVLPFLHRVL